jgi:uncharacterized membrane protein YqaE (UPF0057 family)
MRKIKFKTVASILVVLSIGFTSCSRQYNLTLIKKNYHTNDVAQNIKPQSLHMIDQKKINLVNESNEPELVKATIPIQTPVVVNQTKDLMVTASISKDETGIDKELYNADSRLKSYSPEFENKENNQARNNYDHSNDAFLLYVILAIFIPPLCVGLWEGGLTFDFWIDLLLTICFWLPGVIFALIVIL